MNKLYDNDSIELIVIYSDIVSSTPIVSKLPSEQIPIFYKIFSNEVIRIINDFGGVVYKSVGDEIIAIFPIPDTAWIPTIDDAIRCACYIKDVTKHVISPLAESLSLPKIECRIGLDYGEAQIVNIGVKNIFLSLEILGHVMNVAAKIRGKANPGQITLGDNLRNQLHVSYKLLCKEIDKLIIGENEYRVFQLDV